MQDAIDAGYFDADHAARDAAAWAAVIGTDDLFARITGHRTEDGYAVGHASSNGDFDVADLVAYVAADSDDYTVAQSVGRYFASIAR